MFLIPGAKKASAKYARSKNVKRREKTAFAPIVSILLVLIMIISSLTVLSVQHSSGSFSLTPSLNSSNITINKFQPHGGLIDVPHFSPSVSNSTGNAYNGTISVMVSFSLNNQSSLNSLLSGLQNVNSPDYHRYLTRSQFVSKYSVPVQTYNRAITYFSSFTGLSVREYSDRISMQITGSAGSIGSAFNTTFSYGNGTYHADSTPELPAGIGHYVSFVSGLSDAAKLHTTVLRGTPAFLPAQYSSAVAGYPNPVKYPAFQGIFGSDMQIAYQEQSLLNITYASNEVIATILWSGQNASGQNVGAFYPSDISAYYNATIPSNEPKPHAHGVPVNGAPAPGISSTYDTTGASLENTLDLEMAGSMAPGANIYNVYGPNATYESLYSALAFVLNPNSSYQQLNNVSVISNSWGGSDYNSSVWYSYMEEAAARGITVLASSGDSGDNPASPKNFGGPDNLWYPASMAYNSFGVTAVGGTNVTLGPNLELKNQNAWYMNTSKGWVGSTGGISSVYGEPAWQSSSLANEVIKGAGRGVPDIAGLANNTITFETVNGVSYDSFSRYYTDWGTSVASPLYAGMMAETDAVLHHYDQNNVGYLNPFIYKIADKQFKPYTRTFATGFEQTGSFNSSIGMAAFSNVYKGHNDLYRASYGYNLVTGWGSINAYNFTNYELQTNFSNYSYAIKGVIDNLTLNGLNVTSYKINWTDMKNGNVNTVLNASIQQNLFLANQLGAPVYWVQNVVDFKGSPQKGWTANYSEWVNFPFYGQYPNQVVFEYNWPLGEFVHMPSKFDMKTWLSGSGKGTGQVMYFKFNSQKTLSIPVPGAAYIIGKHDYNYSWNGKAYHNGPYPYNPYLGGLDPQLGLVGGPTLSNGEFESPTSGTMNVSYEPMYSNHYITPKTTTFNNSTDQTGERASNLLWTETSGGNWNLGITQNSGLQGVEAYSPQGYNVSFNETGLPVGAEWFVNLSGGVSFTSYGKSIALTLPAGEYTVNVSSAQGFDSYPGSFTFNVTGNASLKLPLRFVSLYNETFLRATYTIDGNNHVFYKGYSSNLSSLNNSFAVKPRSMAVDPVNNQLYLTNATGRSINIYNLTTHKYLGYVLYPASSVPVNLLYDNYTGYIYAATTYTKVVAMAPGTLSPVWSDTLHGNPPGLNTSLRLADGGRNIVALNYLGNISVMNAVNGNSLVSANISIPYISISYYVDYGPSFAVSGNHAYVADPADSSLLSVDLSTFSTSTIAVPSGYLPVSATPFGSTNIFIGGNTTSDLIYNTTTSSLVTGPQISGSVISSVYDPVSSVQYLFSYGNASVGILTGPQMNQTGVIYAVNATTGKIESSVPGPVFSTSMSIETGTHSLFADGAAYDEVVHYSTSRTYKVTFAEYGLNSGTMWFVNVTGSNSSGPLSPSQNYTLYMSDGQYDYTSSAGGNMYFRDSGTFRVQDSNITVNVTFKSSVYSITIKERGLPVGREWNVSVNGVKSTSNGTSITLREHDGNYAIYIQGLKSYYAANSTLLAVIDNSSVNYTVTYVHYAYITGRVSPVNSVGYIRHDGTNKTIGLSDGTFNLTVEAGQYNLSFSYSPYNASRTVSVNVTPDQVAVVNVTLQNNTRNVSPVSRIEILGGASAIFVAIAGAASFTLVRRRRK